MLTAPQPEFLKTYWENCFDLENHLQAFLKIDRETLQTQLQERRHAVAELGQHFDWELVNDFYRDRVGTAYIFELAAWHLESCDYIGDMVRLIADVAQGRVLDFGGGIGTHSIAAASCPEVTEVQYLDLNPVNCEFVLDRAQKLGLSDKLQVASTLESDRAFDTIMCFDVMEHLSDPSSQLLEFHKLLNSDGKLLINWYFSKGFGNEFPFHLDDPGIVEGFFETLRSNFVEVFHPHLITTRCYRKV
ncbi:MAG: methyltransferase domain-containing protein [Cyanobacteria bacterium SID2]|nr:methyltransferase domain-containing protein [Cyanobacteria bacterium SID2]MBP0003344.1 methyltransferase domain-containing protein [Cyanobacteria bacterium SBC]